MDIPKGDYSQSLMSHLICLARQHRAVISKGNVKFWLRDGCTAPEVLWRVQAIGLSPPPVYAPGDFAMGHPVLLQATEPPPPGHSQLVTNERRIVQQPMHGSAVIVSCPQCGHVGPAIVNKVCPTCKPKLCTLADLLTVTTLEDSFNYVICE